MSIKVFDNMILYYLSEKWKVGDSLLLLYAKGTEKPMEDESISFGLRRTALVAFLWIIIC